MSNLLVYSRPQCHFCQKLKAFLDSKELAYVDVDLQAEPDRQVEMESKTNGIGSVPQLFVGEQHIGDCFFVMSEAGQEKLAQALAADS